MVVVRAASGSILDALYERKNTVNRASTLEFEGYYLLNSLALLTDTSYKNRIANKTAFTLICIFLLRARGSINQWEALYLL